MRIKPEISGVNVVLLGEFNPAIYTPAWFALHDLLPQSAVENADLSIAHSRGTSFSTGWLQLDATPERFQAATLSAPYVRVRDFVVRVFGEHLFHTPIRALGINRDVHFRAPDQSARDRVGRILAPVKPWASCSEQLGLSEEGSGMKSLTMTDTQRDGRPSGGHVAVTVEPSVRIDNGRSGIFVAINDHYVADGDDAEARAQLLAFLENGFDASIQRSDAIVDHVMSLTEKDGRQ